MDQRTYENLWDLVQGARDLITPDAIEDAINESGGMIFGEGDACGDLSPPPIDFAFTRLRALELASKHCQYMPGSTVVEVAKTFYAFLIGGES